MKYFHGSEMAAPCWKITRHSMPVWMSQAAYVAFMTTKKKTLKFLLPIVTTTAFVMCTMIRVSLLRPIFMIYLWLGPTKKKNMSRIWSTSGSNISNNKRNYEAWRSKCRLWKYLAKEQELRCTIPQPRQLTQTQHSKIIEVKSSVMETGVTPSLFDHSGTPRRQHADSPLSPELLNDFTFGSIHSY